jgi:hypothetical protein
MNANNRIINWGWNKNLEAFYDLRTLEFCECIACSNGVGCSPEEGHCTGCRCHSCSCETRIIAGMATWQVVLPHSKEYNTTYYFDSCPCQNCVSFNNGESKWKVTNCRQCNRELGYIGKLSPESVCYRCSNSY